LPVRNEAILGSFCQSHLKLALTDI